MYLSNAVGAQGTNDVIFYVTYGRFLNMHYALYYSMFAGPVSSVGRALDSVW